MLSSKNQAPEAPSQNAPSAPTSDMGPSVDVQRLEKNIHILRQFKQGNTCNLQDYSGFGGLRRALKQANIQNQLKAFLSEGEITALIKSTHTSYFTPTLLIDFIYQVVQKLGFSHGKILEPACGHGAFFARMPKAMRQKSDIIGLEFEAMSAAIARALYPDISIRRQGFHHFQQGGFDCILGNPPYAPFTVFDKEHPDLSTEMIHHYFVAKSTRLLKENGLLAMVVPCYVLDNPKNHLRQAMAEVAELITAYRFPCDLFANAKVTVDVIVLQRKQNPSAEWAKTAEMALPDGGQFTMAGYFVQHPKHVLGKLETYQAYSYFEDRPRTALKCVGGLDETQKKLPALVSALGPLPGLA